MPGTSVHIKQGAVVNVKSGGEINIYPKDSLVGYNGVRAYKVTTAPDFIVDGTLNIEAGGKVGGSGSIKGTDGLYGGKIVINNSASSKSVEYQGYQKLNSIFGYEYYSDEVKTIYTSSGYLKGNTGSGITDMKNSSYIWNGSYWE